MTIGGILFFILFISALVFFTRMTIAIAGVLIAFSLWHLGTWWSMPLGAAVFLGMFYGTTLWD